MDDQDRTVLTRFFIGLAIVITIIVLVWLFVIRGNHKKDTTKPTSKTSTAQEESSEPKSSTATPSSPPTSSTGSGQAVQNQNKPAVASASQQLANAGPGETAAIFAIATTGGTLAHYFYRRRISGSN
jgi:cytoskeletal protein RodZ